jgi:Ankyrin repeats (many copies)
MNPNMPQDELLQRYEQAKAALPDGLPDAPPSALHERIMQAAREQTNAINKVAPYADSIPVIGLKSLENNQKAANDSIWNIKLVASLAVMGLSGLLWWQFEHGTPEEQEAAKSAKPSTSIVAAAPSSLPAPSAVPAPVPMPSAVSDAALSSAPAIAQAPIAATAHKEAQAKKLSEAKTATTEMASPRAEASPLAIPSPASAATPAGATAGVTEPESNRSRTQEAMPATTTAPAAAPTPAAAPAARAAAPAEKTTADASTAAPGYAAPSASAPPSIVSAARPMAAPSARAIIPSPDKLLAAIQAKDAAALRQALSQGASPNARTQEVNTALHQAAIQRWPEGARILLAAGADRSTKNNKGQTAADLALELGFVDMADLLATPR